MENVNEYGTIDVSLNAFKDMADIAVGKIKGIVASKKANNFCECDYKNKKLIIQVDIKINKNLNIIEISHQIQSTIHEQILSMTGVNCKDINVNINGFVSK